MTGAALAILQREWLLTRQRGAAWMQPLVFFAVVITAFVLGTEPGAPWLSAAAPALIWVALLLALIIGSERAFRDDARSGFLQQMMRSPAPLPLLMLAKLAAQWLLVAVPLLLAAPLGMAALDMSARAMLSCWLALLLGSPALSAIAGLGAALTASLPRAGILLPLCVLPLCLPVIIFGSGVARTADAGLDSAGALYFVASISLLCLCGLPFACSAAAKLQGP
ncbi:heme exporter protein CcmB [Algiphilus aromaticivorans]|jgi:heme exporter protein B|uniref:heme exporter protein CcmB n=1 Tax=Algiphilus aromaticivorans TaxID=382454 RepID=UPI0005C22889|nr:heme exporter protein CcmB [Algiphilus aromaticivorans]